MSYPPEVIRECVDWCRDCGVHLVSDEIYAGSVYRTGEEEDGFQIVLSLALNDKNNTNNEKGLGLGLYIHFVYTLSKDFALSGLRVGMA